eukprot:2115530-Pyramimonas_sp.AAC.1
MPAFCSRDDPEPKAAKAPTARHDYLYQVLWSALRSIRLEAQGVDKALTKGSGASSGTCGVQKPWRPEAQKVQKRPESADSGRVLGVCFVRRSGGDARAAD